MWYPTFEGNPATVACCISLDKEKVPPNSDLDG